MAYVRPQIPEDEQNQFSQFGQTTPNPQSLPQAGGSSGSGTNAAPGVATSTQFGSNAAKLSDYLKANKPQVAEFGNKVANTLNQGYSDTMGQINQGFGDFNQQVQQGWRGPSEVDINYAASDPTQFASDPNRLSDFRRWWDGQYAGPDSAEGSSTYADLNKKVNEAVDKANLVKGGDFGGISSYLNNYMGTATNTPGMKTLDTALLQRSPEARQSIQQAAAPYDNLSSYLSGQVDSANQAIAGQKSIAQNTSSGIQNRFLNEVIPGFQGGLQDRLSSARAREDDEANKALNFLRGYYLDQNGLKSTTGFDTYDQDMLSNDLGLTMDEWKELLTARSLSHQEYGNSGQDKWFRPEVYLTSTPASVMGLQNVLNPDDYAKAQALSILSGNPELTLPGNPQSFNSSAFDRNAALAAAREVVKKIRDANPPPPKPPVFPYEPGVIGVDDPDDGPLLRTVYGGF